jgi:outer membrane protein insertion porin family
VIRREFRLVEGDAFNRVLVDRSRTRIKALGFSRTSTSSRRRARSPTARS